MGLPDLSDFCHTNPNCTCSSDLEWHKKNPSINNVDCAIVSLSLAMRYNTANLRRKFPEYETQGVHLSEMVKALVAEGLRPVHMHREFICGATNKVVNDKEWIDKQLRTNQALLFLVKPGGMNHVAYWNKCVVFDSGKIWELKEFDYFEALFFDL